MKMKQQILYLLLGAVITLGSAFMIGAGPDSNQIGRYQVSTCLKRDWVYVYVIDTATGAVKFVDPKNENKPFEQINSVK
jgi:hypothetical protein